MRSSLTEATIRTALALAVLLPLAATLSACNTTAGAGEDISATGHAITNTADQDKPH